MTGQSSTATGKNTTMDNCTKEQEIAETLDKLEAVVKENSAMKKDLDDLYKEFAARKEILEEMSSRRLEDLRIRIFKARKMYGLDKDKEEASEE